MEHDKNTLSQESIDSLNNFIANYERELAAEKTRKEQEYNARVERAYREREAIEATMTYQVSNTIFCFFSGLYELISTCVVGLAKFAIVMFFMLFPAIVEAVIEYML